MSGLKALGILFRIFTLALGGIQVEESLDDNKRNTTEKQQIAGRPFQCEKIAVVLLSVLYCS